MCKVFFVLLLLGLLLCAGLYAKREGFKVTDEKPNGSCKPLEVHENRETIKKICSLLDFEQCGNTLDYCQWEGTFPALKMMEVILKKQNALDKKLTRFHKDMCTCPCNQCTRLPA